MYHSDPKRLLCSLFCKLHSHENSLALVFIFNGIFTWTKHANFVQSFTYLTRHSLEDFMMLNGLCVIGKALPIEPDSEQRLA
jgi:hypothetical protein